MPTQLPSAFTVLGALVLALTRSRTRQVSHEAVIGVVYAVSSAGAVGLMQVMPFWPEQLGMRRRELVAMEPNIRMGCAILRHYLETEHNDVRRALGRYNGSVGRPEYPQAVLSAWRGSWNYRPPARASDPSALDHGG